jgi:hypothetical protein
MHHNTARQRPRDKAEAFLQEMLTQIELEPDLDVAARLARWLALYLWENACGVYRLDKLEDLILSKCPTCVPDDQTNVQTGVELHVASQVYRTGGHTALMRTLIKEGHRPTHVLLTRSDQPEEDAAILGLPQTQVTGTPQQWSTAECLAHLVQCMVNHEKIVLHLHPDDVIGAVAVQLAKRHRPHIRVALVNHADHVFSVGFAAADRVLEISAYGWMLRAKRGTTKQSSFIGIPLAAPAARTWTQPSTAPYVMTGGTSYKFKPMGDMSLPSALTALLNADGQLKLVVIGASGKDWWWWPLRIKFGHRVKLRKAVPKEQYLQYLNSCALYVDSYPWLGGTAFPEALMRGARVAGLRGLAWGYSCADVLRSVDVEHFVQDSLQLLRNDPRSLSRLDEARVQCILYHEPKAVRQRMDACLEQNLTIPPLDHPLDQWPTAGAEEYWQLKGQSVLPSRKRGALKAPDLKRISMMHAHAFGKMNWSSITLAYYAWRKH